MPWRARNKVYQPRYHAQEISTHFHFLTHVLQDKVNYVRQTVYVQCSWLFLLHERLQLTVLSYHICRVIISFPTAIAARQIKTAKNV